MVLVVMLRSLAPPVRVPSADTRSVGPAARNGNRPPQARGEQWTRRQKPVGYTSGKLYWNTPRVRTISAAIPSAWRMKRFSMALI